MVCHRAYRLHLFGLATGRRTFLCHPDGEPTPSDDPTVTTCPESQLVDMLKAYVDRAEAVTLSQRMDICHQAGIHHPGSSIAYLVAHIDDIIAGNIRPEWAYYPLAPDPDGVGSKTHMVLQLASARMANMALLAFSGKYPENREILLFIADSYARTDFMPRYFYQLSLSHFHALTEQASLPSLLKIRAARWWQRRGRHMLDFMLAEAESDSKLLTREITSLRDGYAKIACDEALAGLEDTEFTDLKTLIDLRTLALVDYTGPLSLYGAKKLARAFLACRDVANVDIRSIVDPDPDAQGKELGGLIVQDPASLVESRIPVLICSYDHLPDIFMRLHRSLGGDRALYAICKDRHIADFLPLIAAAPLRIN
jgi:hypothetical protein